MQQTTGCCHPIVCRVRCAQCKHPQLLHGVFVKWATYWGVGGATELHAQCDVGLTLMGTLGLGLRVFMDILGLGLRVLHGHFGSGPEVTSWAFWVWARGTKLVSTGLLSMDDRALLNGVEGSVDIIMCMRQKPYRGLTMFHCCTTMKAALPYTCMLVLQLLGIHGYQSQLVRGEGREGGMIVDNSTETYYDGHHLEHLFLLTPRRTCV